MHKILLGDIFIMGKTIRHGRFALRLMHASRLDRLFSLDVGPFGRKLTLQSVHTKATKAAHTFL